MSFDPFICHSIDHFIGSGCGVALYRLPHEKKYRFFYQKRGKELKLTDIRSLNGKRGFVIAPFCPSESSPVVLIEPEVEAVGIEHIWEICTNFASGDCSVSDVPFSLSPFPDSIPDFGCYKKRFERFMEPIEKGLCEKLVLSRYEKQPLPFRFSPTQLFFEACDRYPGLMISLFHTESTGTWLVCTPECLLRKNGGKWESFALAGTVAISESADEGPVWSAKNLKEHAFVADYIREVLNRFSMNVINTSAKTIYAGHLAHLRTDFLFDLETSDRLGDLLAALHPTPAVCGLPKDFARDFIRANEGFDRKYFTGFFGCLDPDKQTDLYVNLRCMELTADLATLYAGGGIIDTSTCLSEWEETVEKMNTLSVLF